MEDIIRFNTEELVKNSVNGQQAKSKITTYEILPETEEILNEVMPDFDFNSEINAKLLASELIETAKVNKAFGLSANQCGLRYRVFVMGVDDNYVACFNPKILKQSETTEHMVEGCLSFPALSLYITRPKRLEVEYQDYTGEIQTSILEGLTARIFQHELDHLNGLTFINRAKPLALKLGKTKREKYAKRLLKSISKAKNKKK